MGSLLLAAGEPGMRHSLPNSRIMIHQPSGGASGMASDIEIKAKHIIRTKNLLHEFMSEKTGQTIKKLEKDMDRDTFLSAQEAVDYGIVDKIVEHQ